MIKTFCWATWPVLAFTIILACSLLTVLSWIRMSQTSARPNKHSYNRHIKHKQHWSVIPSYKTHRTLKKAFIWDKSHLEQNKYSTRHFQWEKPRKTPFIQIIKKISLYVNVAYINGKPLAFRCSRNQLFFPVIICSRILVSLGW